MEPLAFGKYVLLERLAQGGMAEVYRAMAQGAAGVEKIVALKRILPSLHGGGDFVNMFIDEARIACSLTHVNVAQVFEFGEVGGQYYLAMELIEGVDLGRLADAARKRQMLLPHPVVASVIAEAARGLAYAHDKRGPNGGLLGIVHRDVSPQNVLVSYAGEVKIADFGIAKAMNKLHRTESGAVMGKIRYMSPEQITGEPLDGRSDLFSLGVVLHELLTGRVLFDGDNPGRVSDQVKSAEVKPPSFFVPDIPPTLDRICMKALERARDARYDRAAELARDLSTFVSETAPGFTREDVGTLVAELAPRDAEAPSTLGEAGMPTLPVAMSPSSLAGNAPVFSRPENVRGVSQPTQPERPTEPQGVGRGKLMLVGGVGVALLAGVLGIAYKTIGGPGPQAVAADAGAKALPLDFALAAALAPPVSEAEKGRLLNQLRLLPREGATRRGVPSEDYLTILSAVDASLCASGASTDPVFPPDAMARLEAQKLEPEARALARYVLFAGELPADVAGPFRSFLGKHPAYSAQPPAWAFAALATRLDPTRPQHLVDLLRQNGARHAWRDGAGFAAADASPFASLCDRRAVVARYAALQPGPRADALARYLAAAPVDASVDAGGLRYQVTAAARDEAAARLDVTLVVTNSSGEERALPLAALRLAGLAAEPVALPPTPSLPPGKAREVRLAFAGVSDTLAEAAVLVLPTVTVAPSPADGGGAPELQAYSELLR